MSKKGGSDMALHSVIGVILAIVFLLVALAFYKGPFKKTEEKFEEQITAEPDPIQATPADPITLSRELVKTHAGSTETVKISLFNPTNADYDFSTDPYEVSCEGLDAEISVNPPPIASGAEATFSSLLTLRGEKGSYLCRYSFAGLFKDLSVQIN